MLNNPAYIGVLRRSPTGARAISKRDYKNDDIMIAEGCHDAIITKELWDKAQERIKLIKATYPKFAKREQPIDYMLKGLVRCSACGGTLAMGSAMSGKNKNRTLQCCNYARGSCTVSHSIVVPKITNALIEGLEQVIETKQFNIVPKVPKKSDTPTIDYDKLIAVEERRLQRAKEAYLAGTLDDAGAEKILLEHTDMDEEEVSSKVSYWAFCREHPDVDLNETQVEKYHEFAEPADIPLDVFEQYVEGTSGLNTIYDDWGDEVKSKREQVLEVIDSLPLTWQQKDALYLAAGYAESKIWDVPW